MSNAGAAFLEICADQRADLNRSLVPIIEQGELPDWPDIGYTTGVLAGVIAVARSLEDHPEAELAEHPLDVTAFQGDVPSRLLAELINKSFGIEQAHDDAVFYIEQPSKVVCDTCPDLETCWKEVFTELEMGIEGFPLVQIFTKDGIAVAMRKGRGNPTSLLLKSAEMGKNSVVYPAGSVVDISTPHDEYSGFGDGSEDVAADGIRRNLSGRRLLIMSPVGLQLSPVSDIKTMSFRRLAPYGVPGPQRDKHFKGLSEQCKSIEEIQALAQRTVENQLAQQKIEASMPRRAWSRMVAALRAI